MTDQLSTLSNTAAHWSSFYVFICSESLEIVALLKGILSLLLMQLYVFSCSQPCAHGQEDFQDCLDVLDAHFGWYSWRLESLGQIRKSQP